MNHLPLPLLVAILPPTSLTLLALLAITGGGAVATAGLRTRRRTLALAGAWTTGIAGIALATYVLFFLGLFVVFSTSLPFPFGFAVWPFTPFIIAALAFVALAKAVTRVDDRLFAATTSSTAPQPASPE